MEEGTTQHRTADSPPKRTIPTGASPHATMLPHGPATPLPAAARGMTMAAESIDPPLLPDTFAGWISLTSPHLLPLALAPALVVSLALWAEGHPISLALTVLTLLALVFLRAGTGMLASVRDASLDANLMSFPDVGPEDAAGARTSGSTSVPLLTRTGVAPTMVSVVGLAFLAVGCVLGLPVALAGGQIVWAIGLVAVAAIIVYQSVPGLVRVAALSEVLAAVALGPALGFVVARSQQQPMTPFLWLLSLALGLLALAVMLATDLRDLPVHAFEGRFTLAYLLQPMTTALVCAGSMVVAFGLMIAAAVPVDAPHGALLVGFALPGAVIAATGVILARAGAPRERAAREVLRLYSLAALWLVIGLVADGIVRHFLTAFHLG